MLRKWTDHGNFRIGSKLYAPGVAFEMSDDEFGAEDKESQAKRVRADGEPENVQKKDAVPEILPGENSRKTIKAVDACDEEAELLAWLESEQAHKGRGGVKDAIMSRLSELTAPASEELAE